MWCPTAETPDTTASQWPAAVCSGDRLGRAASSLRALATAPQGMLLVLSMVLTQPSPGDLPLCCWGAPSYSYHRTCAAAQPGASSAGLGSPELGQRKGTAWEVLQEPQRGTHSGDPSGAPTRNSSHLMGPWVRAVLHLQLCGWVLCKEGPSNSR